MRSDALFIGIEVSDDVASDHELAAKLTEVCPVDIYAQDDDGALQLVEKNLDECVLCELCINAAPAGTVEVLKLYSGEKLPT
ncbi:MAG TPA: ferredoxin family protein [Solirubrobacteraceae bacterium]|jgi:NAD-dependent dihydropyrimidine dehydrogenase PreA subunit